MLYVCLKVSTKTDAVMLNFCRCKTRFSAFSQKFSATTPIFYTFSVEPLVISNCALYNWKLSHRLRDIRLLSILETRVRGYSRSSKIIKLNPAPTSSIVTIVLSRSVSVESVPRYRPFPSKIANFSYPHVLNAPDEGVGFPLEFGIVVRGPKCLHDGATRWSKKF